MRSILNPAGRFDRDSYVVLAIGLLIVAYGAWLGTYWRSLPSDGWTSNYDPQFAEPVYVFVRNPSGAPSPIQPGDVLLAVEGQPLADIHNRAVRLQPRRPANWVEGGTVQYTVLRQGRELDLQVRLARRPLSLLDIGVNSPVLVVAGWLMLVMVMLIGPLVFWLRPRQHAARILYLFSASFFCGVMPLGGWSYLAVLFHAPAFAPSLFLNPWAIGLLPLVVHLLAVFPYPKPFLVRRPRLALAAIYLTVPVLFWTALVLTIGGWASLALVPPVSGVLLLLTFVIGAALAVHSLLTVRDPVGQAQMRWLAFGLVIGVMSGFLAYGVSIFVGPNELFTALTMTLPAALPISLALAILRYRLFDIDVIIRRTLVYAGLSALLVLSYLGLVVVLQQLFQAVTGQRQSEAVVVLSTLAIAALAAPLRARVQAFVDRRFYRRKYNVAQTLAAFAASARDNVELDALTSRLLAVVDDTMQPAHVSLWLRPASDAHPAAPTAGRAPARAAPGPGLTAPAGEANRTPAASR